MQCPKLFLLQGFSSRYNYIKAAGSGCCTLKNAIRPYPETGSHQQMSLRKKEDSDTENAP